MSDRLQPPPFAGDADDGGDDPNRVVHLALRYAEGTIGEEELTQLETLLVAKRSHRRLFVAMCVQSQLMREALEPSRMAIQESEEPSAAELLDEVLEQQRIAAERRAAEATQRQRRRRQEAASREFTLLMPDEVDLAPVRHVVIPRWLAAGTVAAVAAMIVMLAYPLVVHRDAEPADRAPRAAVVRSQRVARVIESVAGQWADGPVTVGEALHAGDYALHTGLATIAYANGASVLIEAPASFRLENDTLILLHRGRLVGHCSTLASRGFTVRTPNARLVDLGTEFGVAVEDDHHSAVHVFSGRVALTALGGVGAEASSMELHADESGEVDQGGLRRTTIAHRFIRTMPSPYEWAIRQSAPMLHWRPEEEHGDAVARHAAAQIIARENQAAHFDRDTGVVEIEAPEVSERLSHSFSIEAWVRPSSGVHSPRAMRILTTGRGGGRDGLGFGVVPPGSRLTRGGMPPYALLFTFWDISDYGSVGVVEPDRWSHVVVTVDASGAATFYINGERVPSRLWWGSTSVGSAAGRPILIGGTDPTVGGDADGPWLGGLDEVAIYDRILTPAEVAHHFRAGRIADDP